MQGALGAKLSASADSWYDVSGTDDARCAAKAGGIERRSSVVFGMDHFLCSETFYFGHRLKALDSFVGACFTCFRSLAGSVVSPSDVTLPCSGRVHRARGCCLSCQLRLGTLFSGPEHKLTHHSGRVTSAGEYIMRNLNVT